MEQGRRKDFFKGGGVVLNVNFQKGSFCTDLFLNSLYRKCIKFGPKKGGSSDPSDPLLPTPPVEWNARLTLPPRLIRGALARTPIHNS